MIDVGKMIARIRKDRGYSQQQLADKLNLSKQAVSNYETGKREPDYVTLEAIADALNVPITMLISPEEKEEALNAIYATYTGKKKNTAPAQPPRDEINMSPAKLDRWIMLSNAFNEMSTPEFEMWFNAIRANHPEFFNERTDDDDPES